MKVFLCNDKKIPWYKRADWVRVLIVFVITFVIFFFLFYYLFGNETNFEMAISNSFLIGLLISIGTIISSFLENRINVYVEKNKKIYALFPHPVGSGYDDTLISYKKFKEIIANDNLENIFDNQSKYYGIDIVEFTNIIKIKRCLKRVKCRVKVNASEWDSGKSLFFVNDNFKLTENNKTMTFLIPSDYEKYDELYDLICNIKNS